MNRPDPIAALPTAGASVATDGAGPAAPGPAATPAPAAAAADPLSPIRRRFVMHWGEMGSRWGVNRTVAQIHALLFLAGRPMDAEEIAATLYVARSNVSTSLRELQNLNLVRAVHLVGARREHFETSRDVWELMRTVVRERKAREFDPTVGVLRELQADPAFAAEDADVRERVAQTLELMQSMSAWGEQMLKLEPKTLMKVMKLGAKIRKLLGEADA
jgi:DNA-binding transcriptional regulator GbsR (MarR family)